MPDNKDKNPPKGNVRFSISLSEEQKLAKAEILIHPYNFIIGKAGSGKTLLAVRVALDQFFKRQYNKIIITRPTISTEDNGFLIFAGFLQIFGDFLSNQIGTLIKHDIFVDVFLIIDSISLIFFL